MNTSPFTPNNTLYFGDNLAVLKQEFPNECVDLIYLDPPFNSNRNYNVLFKDERGKDSESQIVAFEDTWHWTLATEATFFELVTNSTERVSMLIGSMRQFIGSNQMMAYLVMMTARLVELHRVLKSTGSLWLHCDPAASHYLKIILDNIFGPEQFRSEVIWKRTSAHSSANRPGPIHDVLLFFTKSSTYTWNQQYQPYEEEYVKEFYRYTDDAGRHYQLSDLMAAGTRNGSSGQSWRGIDPKIKGNHWKYTIETLEKLDAAGRIYWPSKGSVPRYKRFLDEMKGIPLQDIWIDLPPVSAHAAERLGYPTQKPEKLLERIIQTSSNLGDIVLDPFCGCGTTIAAAHRLGRLWKGIDITYLSIALQKYRLGAMSREIKFDEVGIPNDSISAHALAVKDRYQFQWWALSLIKAMPIGGSEGSKQGKKGPDKGIDGVISFIDDASNKPKRILVQVKSGHVKSGDIRDLVGTVQREQACMGIFLTLEEPTQDMKTEAYSAGLYMSPGLSEVYPKIQIVTIQDLLNGRKAQIPPTRRPIFDQVSKIGIETVQGRLF